jgi:hypothetical protein
VTDVWPRVGDLSMALPSLRKGQTLLEACQMIAQTRRPAALLDDDNTPLGLLTGSGLFANLADALSSANVLALAKEFDRPAESTIISLMSWGRCCAPNRTIFSLWIKPDTMPGCAANRRYSRHRAVSS